MSVAVIDRNDVVLRGRLSAPAEVKTLPSGDTLVSFRLVVRRPEPRATGQSTDTLPCITYDRALQRRFWRTGSGTASVTEVNCRRGRKVPRSAGPDARTA